MYYEEERVEKTKRNISSDAHFHNQLNRLNKSSRINIKKNTTTEATKPETQSNQVNTSSANNMASTNRSTDGLLQSQNINLLTSLKLQPQVPGEIKTGQTSNTNTSKSLGLAEISNTMRIMSQLNKKNDWYNSNNNQQIQYLPMQNTNINNRKDNNPFMENQEDFWSKITKSIEEKPQENQHFTKIKSEVDIPMNPYEKNLPEVYTETSNRYPHINTLEDSNNVDFLKGIISEKEKQNKNIMKENQQLISIKEKLESAIIYQNELINGLNKKIIETNPQLTSTNYQIQQSITQKSHKKIIRQKCPNATIEDLHFLSWNSNKKTHTNCSNCGLFKSCRWICKFCDEQYCIVCVPDCIFEGKCYLEHELKEEILGSNRECDRCGDSNNNCLFWTDCECGLDFCRECYIELEKTNKGNFIVEDNEYFKALFRVELNDYMEKKFERKNEKKNMNSIESNSYMFLTVFLMMFVPFLFLFIAKILGLIFPCRLKCWKKSKKENDEQQNLIENQESSCFNYYKTRLSKNNLLFILKLMMVLFCFSVLMVPSFLVIVIQIWCLLMFENEETTITYDSFFVLKYFIIWIFVLMICQETSKTINAIYFVAVKYIINDILNVITLIISLSPLICFLFVCWYLCYFNMITIIEDDNLIDVIQNFAGFFILLEFGKIILHFLKSIHFNDFFSWITSSDLIKISLNVGNCNFKIEKTLGNILNHDEFCMEEIYEDLKGKSIFFQYFFFL